MTLTKVESANAPKPIGPYSQAVLAGDTLYLAGQIAIDPNTGSLVDGGIQEQATQLIDNLSAVLAELKMGLDKIVRVDVYLADFNDVQGFNEIYSARFITDPRPARATVQVSRLPMGARVEMSAIAYLGH